MEIGQICKELNLCMEEQDTYVNWWVFFGLMDDPLIPVIWEMQGQW